MAPSRDFASHQTGGSTSLPSYVPVLIVGGGPTGLLQALLLSRLGVQSLIIERYPERLAAPKAHAISPRSLEILRQLNLGEKHVCQQGTSRDDSSSFNFLTNLCGEAIGRLPYERMDTAVLNDTPEMIHNIPQPVLEQELSNFIAKDPNVTLIKGFSIYAVEQTENAVVATIEQRSTGQLHQTKSRHLIACDGRRSKVRELLGIESESEDSDQTMMTIHFNANLRPVVGDRVGMLYWIMDPVAAGFIIGYDLDGIQVHISQVDVEQHPVESWTEDMCRAKIRGAIGKDDVPFNVLSYRPWVFRRQVAITFQEGNIFLAGDAAHSFPPTGGLGLNCGLADVHNLAYKIALVHRGVASPSILSTYTAERRGVADSYSKQSVKNGKEIFALLRSLKTVGVENVVQARRNMMAALADPAQRKQVEAGIEAQREHFDNEPVDVSYVKELDADQVRACQWSTLDLCGPDSWSLILGKEQQDTQITLLQKHFSVIGLPLHTWRLGEDFEVVGQSWFANELVHGGGILIRPDQHILARVSVERNAEDVILIVNKHLGIA
ncbi:Monooxygenase, FAD-binding [Penicillium italicum]|uniref:Monooxygenase, FAD-binding n=1 Tax=Penicillium italicum TaxID=40296 RepID=A0A0A2L4J7_PENIT|nr:Monooxygenase, FAD-binding [Penicillium italicum]